MKHASMSDLRGAKPRWAVAAVTAGALVASVVFIFPAPRAGDPATPMQIRSFGLKRAPAEETLMGDLTPLFLPTDRNAGASMAQDRQQPETLLEVAPPSVGIIGPAWRFDQGLAPLATLNGKEVAAAEPLDLLEPLVFAGPLPGYGRAPVEVKRLKDRGGWIEITNTRTGTIVFTQEIRAEVRPNRGKPWQPVEFVAAIGPAGLVAPLTTAVRSGVEEVDAFFRNYLVRTFALGERLSPGFYRITVTP